VAIHSLVEDEDAHLHDDVIAAVSLATHEVVDGAVDLAEL